MPDIQDLAVSETPAPLQLWQQLLVPSKRMPAGIVPARDETNWPFRLPRPEPTGCCRSHHPLKAPAFPTFLATLGELSFTPFVDGKENDARKTEWDGWRGGKGIIMISWAITFLVVALIAAVLGFGALAGTAMEIAKIIFVVAIILFLISAVATAWFGVVVPNG